jgi:hypothetical protein
VGEAEVFCSGDRDFFTPPASKFLEKIGIVVMVDVALIERLRQ